MKLKIEIDVEYLGIDDCGFIQYRAKFNDDLAKLLNTDTLKNKGIRSEIEPNEMELLTIVNDDIRGMLSDIFESKGYELKLQYPKGLTRLEINKDG